MLLSRVSLAALRTFAEVARQQSLSRAAARLYISQSAVSHQMKLLEQQLDVRLFTRKSRGIELTPAGNQLAEHASQAMQQLENGLQQARQLPGSQLRIAIIPALCQHWLLPRLADFYQHYPDIELHLLQQDQLADFNQQAIDLHLHFGHGEFIGLNSRLLMEEQAVPVCSPALLSGYDGPQALLQSDSVRRLHYQAGEEDQPGGLSWNGWFNQAGGAINPAQPVTHFSHLGPALTAATAGLGMVLAWQRLVEPELQCNELVALSDVRVPLKYSYYAVAPAHHFERRNVQIFTSWLTAQCSNDARQPEP